MNCRVCDSTRMELAVDLGRQPWANHFLTREECGREPKYPLCVMFCHNCTTAQLDHTIRKEVMFGDHTYLSGITRTLSDHFQAVAKEVDQRFFRDIRSKAVLDIGSNDGTQLRHYADLGYDVLGVESAKTVAAIANRDGIETLNRFFNHEVAREIDRKFRVINAAGIFFHLEELHSATEGIRDLLHDDGVFVVQFLYMKRIVENCAFDQIYHEHLLYYNLQTIEKLLNRFHLSMFDAYVSPIHGGSVIGLVTHRGRRCPMDRLVALRRAEADDAANKFSTYTDFATRIERFKQAALAYLDDRKAEGKTIYGFGAPVKGNTLLNYLGTGTDYFDYLVEKNELRQGLYSPGMHIPLIMEWDIKEPPDIYFVLAWNFKREILANNRVLIDQGVEFFFPIDPDGQNLTPGEVVK